MLTPRTEAIFEPQGIVCLGNRRAASDYFDFADKGAQELWRSFFDLKLSRGVRGESWVAVSPRRHLQSIS